MIDPWADQASALLDFTLGEPKNRALRSAAILSSLFEEDPLLHEWCGCAAFIARLHADSLAIGVGFYDGVIAEWNRASYDLMVPAMLAFRSGVVVEGRLSEGFARLTDAREIRKEDRAQAMALARQGTDLLIAADQQWGVQPICDSLPEIILRGFGPFVGVNFGESTPEPLVFEGEGFPDLNKRQAWMKNVIVPAWRRAMKVNGQGVVNQLRTMQFKGWFKTAELPKRGLPV